MFWIPRVLCDLYVYCLYGAVRGMGFRAVEVCVVIFTMFCFSELLCVERLRFEFGGFLCGEGGEVMILFDYSSFMIL